MLSDCCDRVVLVSLCSEHVDLVRMVELSPDSRGHVETTELLIWSPDLDSARTDTWPGLLWSEADLPSELLILSWWVNLSSLRQLFRALVSRHFEVPLDSLFVTGASGMEKEAATAGIGMIPVNKNLNGLSHECN